jgi:hypothetical protein
MASYSVFIDGILSDSSLLQKLRPSELSNPIAAVRTREATDEQILSGRQVVDENLFPFVRCGLFYAVDALDEANRIAGRFSGDISCYWQGMIQRRFGDFGAARALFRRVGLHPVFGDLQRTAAQVSPDMAKQSSWDPYLFVGLCERDQFGARQFHNTLAQLQRIEFDVLFEYVWRRSVV